MNGFEGSLKFFFGILLWRRSFEAVIRLMFEQRLEYRCDSLRTLEVHLFSILDQ